MAFLLAVSVGLTGAVTLPLKELALEGMESLPKIGLALLATSGLLAAAQAVGARRGEGGRTLEEMRFSDAALLGAFQSLSAIFHGFSRSGNTISMGLFAGLSRRAAAEYSFLLSVPTILAAALVENVSEYRATGHLVTHGNHLSVYLAGMATAAVVGYAAVAGLLRLVVSMKLQPFIVYTALLGSAVLLAGLR
jgi:undecaprenyl-diphosphatase